MGPGVDYRLNRLEVLEACNKITRVKGDRVDSALGMVLQYAR